MQTNQKLVFCFLALIAVPMAEAATRTVINLNDTGSGTLREAIALAANGDTIAFATGLTGTVSLASALSAITNDVSITAPSVESVTINGNLTNRIFNVASGKTVTISGLGIVQGADALQNFGSVTLTNCTIGNCAYGECINNGPGNLVLYGCRIAGNSVRMFSSGQMALINTTVADNSVATGGFMVNYGTLTLTNCTLSRNSSSGGDGGAIFSAFALTVSSCTICSNSSGGHGGGIFRSSGTVQIQNTIIAGNRASIAGRDVFGAITSLGYNLIGATNDSTGWVVLDQAGTTITPINPLLGPLQNNGGGRFTHALLPGSPAIDGGQSSGLATDQRGVTRPYDNPGIANAAGGDGSDIGAFEAPLVSVPGNNVALARVVTTLNNSGPGSLREALSVSVSGDAVNFDSTLAGTISLLSSLPGTRGDITITEPNFEGVTVDGNGTNAIFATSGGRATISGVVIARGGATGGLANNGGTLTVDHCTVRNCVGGFCIFNAGSSDFHECLVSSNSVSIHNQGTMTLNNSTISDNSFSIGGFIANYGTLTITNCTLSRNSTFGGNGGAINNSGNLIVSSSTICSNFVSGSGGGIYRAAGTVQLRNTIVAGNSASVSGNDPDVYGAVASLGYNLIGIASSVWTSTDLHGQIGTPINPLLGPLQNNGGLRSTHALLPGSPAIDAGHSGGLATDQRGSARPSDNLTIANASGGDGSDIGAYEVRAGLNLLAIVSGGGVVLKNPNQVTFQTNASVTLTAIPDAGWTFSNWSGDATGANNPLPLVMTSDNNITAHFTATVSACVVAPSGLVNWWPGAGNANDIIGGNNGTLQNGATNAPGKVGTAFSFDGVDDRVAVPGYGTNIPRTEITVEFWQKVSAVRNQSAFSWNTFISTNVFNAHVPYGDGKVYWDFGDIGTSGRLSYTPPVSLVGTWQHFAMTASQSGNYMRIYRNGVLEASKVGMTPLPGGNLDLLIGGQSAVPFGGLIDEVSIYNRALSDSEIAALYNAGSAGKCQTPVYITSVGKSGANVNLSWLAQQGLGYRAQYKTNLSTTTPWIDVSGDVTATSSTASRTDSTLGTAPQRFYRVELLQ